MNNDFINKGFKKEFYENIDEYIEQINKSLKNEKNKTDEKINELQKIMFPEGELYDNKNILTKLKSWNKNKKFKKKIKGIRQKEKEYENKINKLENIKHEWNLKKAEFEQNFIKKEKVIKNNIKHIELDWVKRIELKNNDRDELREIESPLLFLIDDNEWHVFEGVNERFYQDSI